MTFTHFPIDPDLYAEDIKPIVKKTIESHGMQEWKAGALTHEIHGHLGIYTIAGVKMGIKALEHFHAEAGKISIESFAGVIPPISCMNDGLQVSAGATLGHGLIISRPTAYALPQAIFTYQDKSIRIHLKEKVFSMITKEISDAVSAYGTSGDDYWLYIRKRAIAYWQEWNRHAIFEICE